MNDRKGWLYRLSILRKEILFGMISLYKIIKRTQYKLTLLACFAPLQREVYNNAIIVFGPEPVELRWIIFLIGKNQIRWIVISDIETQFCPTKYKRSICISDFLQTTFFYLGRFLKNLADDQCPSITKDIDSIYLIKHMYIQHFTTVVVD